MPVLYDHLGNPIKVERRQAVSPPNPWSAVGTGRRAKGWNPTTRSQSALLAGYLTSLRSRSRQEVRDNAWASSLMDTYAANTVGLGIVPTPRVDDDVLREELLELWEDWVGEADSDDRLGFYGLQSLIAREVKEAGECFVRFRNRRISDGLAVPLQLQLIEGEQLDHGANRNLSDRRTLICGIEFDRRRKRRAYWFWSEHPGDHIHQRFQRLQVKVPADQVLHIYPMLRAGQVRGTPGLAVVMTRLREVSEAEDAALMKMKIQSLYTTFETVPDESDSVIDAAPSQTTEYDDDDIQLAVSEPGTHVLLPPGHDIKFGDPPEGASDLEIFLRAQLRAVAAGAGATYEQVTGDLSMVNFSSIRAGLIELYRKLDQTVAQVYVHQLCKPVWQRFLTTAVISGAIQIPESLRQGNEWRRLMRPHWTSTPGREYVDPEKEVKALERAVLAGFTPRREVVRRYGLDIAELERMNAEDAARADTAGNRYSSDFRYSTDNSDAIEPEPEPDPNQEPGDGRGDVAARPTAVRRV